MRIKKTYKAMLVVVALALLTSGCKLYNGPYSFRQDASNIDRIAICTYECTNRTVTKLVELSDAEEKELLAELSVMECSEYPPGDYPREYGEVIICIYYADGETEIIGETNIGWISPEGRWSLTSYHYDWATMRSLISRYVKDFSLIAEDNKER